MVSAHEQSIHTNSKAPPQNLFAKPAAAARDAPTVRQPRTTTALQSSSESRKRKRGQDASAAFAQRAITIRPCPTAPFDRPTILTPLKLIARAQLPLSCLDLAHPISSPGASSSRLFTAHIEALEAKPLQDEDATTRDANDDAPKVLVTKLQASKTLFAVERVQRGVYALCKLADWVKVDDLDGTERASHRAHLQSQYVQPTKALKNEHGSAWWKGAAVSDQQSEAKAAVKTDKTPRLQMARPKPAVPKDDPFVETQLQDPFADPMAVDGPELLPERPHTAEEVFQTLVQQYLEMLYLSKTSLAFFVKGPLSRARAAFTSHDGNGALKVGGLAAFFRSILLQLGQVDKKYREKIPDIVKELPLPGFSDDEDGAAAAAAKCVKKKKSKSKKMKPNKEGMYPGEDEYVKQWWTKDFPSSPGAHSEETPDDLFKRKAGELRIRESMAQVVLVLEILALEASPGFQAADQDETQQETQVDSQPPEKKKRKKKAQDLNVLLDLLLDKLCIWQTVEQDEMLVKISKSGQGGTAAAETPNSTKAGTSDKLRGFCVEVIIPFYMGRLPEKAAAINKRLGGPSASPSKAPGSSSSRSKPGEATTRNPPSVQRTRKPLQRVATENATKPASRAPSLARSATDSALTAGPVFKRESSEVSLSSIPFMKPPASSRNSSLSQFQRFAKREIDLQEMSATTEAKIRKKERIARELKEAISTLSKPNRASAVKEYADSTDRSKMLGLAGSTRPGLTKKSAARTTTTTTAASGRAKEADKIQVGATPKKPRRPASSHHLVDATPTHHRSYAVDPRDHSHHLAGTFMHRDDPLSTSAAPPPPSSDPVVIPASAIKPGPILLNQTASRSTSSSAPFTSSSHSHPFSQQRPPNPPSNPFPAADDDDDDDDDTTAVLATPSRPRTKLKSVSFDARGYDPSNSDIAVVETPLPAAPAARQQQQHQSHVSSFASRLQPSFKLPPPPASDSSCLLGGGGAAGVVLATPTKPKMKREAAGVRGGGGPAGGGFGRAVEAEVEEDVGENGARPFSLHGRKLDLTGDDSDDEDDDDDAVDAIDSLSHHLQDAAAASRIVASQSPVNSGSGGHYSSISGAGAGAGSKSGMVAADAAAEAEADADVDLYKALGWDDADDL